MLAAASGGLALTGIGMYIEKESSLVGCTMPVLAPPDRVTALGVFVPFESKILKTTSETDAENFQTRACSVGMSMASSMHKERSAKVSGKGWLSPLKTGGSYEKDSKMELETKNDKNSSSHVRNKTTNAQITEYIMMPSKYTAFLRALEYKTLFARLFS